ncbi:hypothetical protein M8494_36170 [Serratia ureilytica]
MREEVADVLSAVTRTDPTLNESVAKLDRTFDTYLERQKKSRRTMGLSQPNSATFDLSKLSADELRSIG